ENPPFLAELYAARPFLAVVQNGLNSVVGNPTLAPEQNWQFEVGFRANYPRLRAGLSLFYAWIHDYITFEVLQTGPFQILRYVNPDRAPLSGFEAYGEYDLTCWLTPSPSRTFVDAWAERWDNRGANVPSRHLGINSPRERLPSIPPL